MSQSVMVCELRRNLSIVGFAVERFYLGAGEQVSVHDQFHPVATLIGLFGHGSEFGDKLSLRPSATGGAVVRADGGSRANQLIGNRPLGNGTRQCIDERHHPHREFFVRPFNTCSFILFCPI